MPGERGHIHIISMILLCLAIIGALHLYKSYREEHLRESLFEALDEEKLLADEYIADEVRTKIVSTAYRQARQAIAESSRIADEEPLIRKVIAAISELAEKSRREREER